MTAYYNENDSFAAAWLRNLITEGVIAKGEVDERSIVEVQPEDLKGFTQVHLFAGIGGWSHSLRSAGWPDDEPVWTGSCPCPPFSAAGKKGCPVCKKNHGTATRLQFLGDGHVFGCPSCAYRDPRHLWPEMWRLVEKRRPATLFGEQVASADGRTWIDIVQSDLEAADYAFAPINLCAAGLGAPHIRQRFFFVADSDGGNEGHGGIQRSRKYGQQPKNCSTTDVMVDAERGRCEQRNKGKRTVQESDSRRAANKLGNSPGRIETRESRPATAAGPIEHLEFAEGHGRESRLRIQRENGRQILADGCPPGPTNGYWLHAVWIPCKDGSYRPTQPEIFPLVDGPSRNRVGLLRGAGNAIVAPVAEAFIRAFIEVRKCS